MKKRKENILQYEAILEPNGAGYTVTVPKLPGLVTEGSNIKEAREMAKDAIKCYLESLLKGGLSVFGSSRREKVTVSV